MTIYLSIQEYQLSFPHSLKTAQVNLKKRSGWRLCLYKERELLGLGEIAPWVGFGAGLASVTKEMDQLCEDETAQTSVIEGIQKLLNDKHLLNQLSELEDFSQRLELLSQALHPLLNHYTSPETRFGLETLALDALARRLNLPLSMLLEPKTTLSADTHHLAKSYKEAIALARRGYKALKIKVGVKDHWVEELMKIARIRATLPDIELRVDANQAWDAELAFGFCVAAQAFNVAWIEEPCHSAQELFLLETKLKDLKACSIGLDESLSQNSLPQSKLLSHSRVSHCTLKPMFIGGLIACAQQALELRNSGKSICITHALGSWIERTACAHLVSALQVHDPELSAGLGGGLNDDICPALQVFGGEVRLHDQAGLGHIEFDRLGLNSDLNAVTETPLSRTTHSSVNPTDTLKANCVLPNPLRMATLARPHHISAKTTHAQISYLDLSLHALILSERLKKIIHRRRSDQGVDHSKQYIISLAAPLSIDWLICFHAISAQAWICAPLNPKLTLQENLHSLTLVQAQYHCQLGQGGLELYAVEHHDSHTEPTLTYLETFELKSHDVPNPTPQTEWRQRLNQLQDWDWQQTLVIICTSGTTGVPQAIPLSVSQLYLSAFGSAIRLGHDLNDTWLACLPPYHVGGLSTVLRCLLYQTCIHIVEAKAKAIYSALPNSSLVSLTPNLLNDLVDEINLQNTQTGHLYEAPSKLRVILVGGGPTNEDLWEKAHQLNLPIRLTWGMSEAASQLCTQIELAPPHIPLPPLPFASIDHDHQGYLWITGPLVSDGHLKSNDLGDVNEQGVKVLGRADDAIISGGINISPQEIEAVLTAHPLIQESAVIGQDHAKYGQRPIAFLVSNHESPPSVDELKQWCRARLSPYKTPDEFQWCAHLPRNELGKLQRRKLKLTPELYLIPSHQNHLPS